MNDDEIPNAGLGASGLNDRAVSTWKITHRRDNGALAPRRFKIGRGAPH